MDIKLLTTLRLGLSHLNERRYKEAAIQRCSWEMVLWKYAANLQENTYVEVRFQKIQKLCKPKVYL